MTHGDVSKKENGMKFSKTTLGSAVLAATLATALSTTTFAQTSTNRAARRRQIRPT